MRLKMDAVVGRVGNIWGVGGRGQGGSSSYYSPSSSTSYYSLTHRLPPLAPPPNHPRSIIPAKFHGQKPPLHALPTSPTVKMSARFARTPSHITNWAKPYILPTVAPSVEPCVVLQCDNNRISSSGVRRHDSQRKIMFSPLPQTFAKVGDRRRSLRCVFSRRGTCTPSRLGSRWILG